MRNYKKSLLEQFKSSQGISSNDTGKKIYMLDFMPWILEQQKIGENYTEFLKFLEFDFEGIRCAEVGKNQFDTVVKPYETTIITPNIEGLETLDGDRVINGLFEVYQDYPSIILSTHKERIILEQSDIRTYMTQNPYAQTDFANWHRLHNSKEAGIILGVYGSLDDKDIETKINWLKRFKDKLTGNIKEGYEEHNGEYYYVVGSEIKVKKLSKNLSK